MRSLLVLVSYHNHNTEKIALVFSRVLDAPIRTPTQVSPLEVGDYDIIGFGSGIYGGRHHESLLRLADELPALQGKKAFIFSTCGVPVAAFEGRSARGRFDDYVEKNHSALRSILRSKGYTVVDEFSCGGHNTNSFLKLFGGINKGRPNAEDLSLAEEFAIRLRRAVVSPELMVMEI